MIGSVLDKEEPILELESEQGDEEEYQVEEPSDEENQINVLWDFRSDGNDDEGDNIAKINANEIHTCSKGPLSGVKKPLDCTKQDVLPVKESSPKVPIENSRPGGQSKNTPVASHPEKENASPTAIKATQHGKLPLKNGKTGMFTLPYPIYNIDYNIVDNLKKSRANIT